jgi:protein SCO1/2
MLIVIIPTFFTKGVSRLSTDKEVNLPFILNGDKDIELIFFGYAGCSDICTPRLYAINNFYNTLNSKIKEKVIVKFLDISTPYDETLPSRFAQFFNPDFQGVYLAKDVLRDYTKAFNVFFSKSLLDETEYDHTTNLYLLKRNKNTKVIRYIYSAYPYDFKQITLDIEELINEQ